MLALLFVNIEEEVFGLVPPEESCGRGQLWHLHTETSAGGARLNVRVEPL